jgi:hypothetical protein
MTYNNATVRLYMIAGYDLASRDTGSDSDPYLRISCGETLIDERDFHLDDEPNPQFNRVF